MLAINPGLIYLLGAGGLYLARKKFQTVGALLISLTALIYVYFLPLTARAGQVDFLNLELVLLSVDQVSKFIGLVLIAAGIIITIYSRRVVDKSYYWLAYLYIGSAVCLVFVGDLFSFYIGWELMTITSFFLLFKNQLDYQISETYF